MTVSPAPKPCRLLVFLPLCSLPTALLPKFRPLVAGQRRPLRWFCLLDVQSASGLAARLIPCFGCCPPPVAVWVAKRFIPGLAMGRNNAVVFCDLMLYFLKSARFRPKAHSPLSQSTGPERPRTWYSRVWRAYPCPRDARRITQRFMRPPAVLLASRGLVCTVALSGPE